MKKTGAICLALALSAAFAPEAEAQQGWGWGWSSSLEARTLNAASLVFTDDDTRIGLIGFGQSNSICSFGGTCTVSVTYSGDVLDHTGLGDLTAVPATTVSNWLRQEYGASPARINYSRNRGVSGKDWNELRKGGAEPTNWTTMMSSLESTHSSVAAMECYALWFVHGESDSWDNCNGSTCDNVYRSYLNDLQSDFEADCTAETGQTRQPAVFFTQLASWHVKTGVECNGPSVALEQAAAASANSLLFLAAPTFHLGLGTNTVYGNDGTHFGDNGTNANRGHILLGEYLGRAMAETFVHDRPWKPLRVLSAVASGSTIDLTYDVPCTRAGNCSGNPLVIDTTAVIEAHSGGSTNYGYVVYDPNPNPRHVTSVAIVGTSNVLRLTLNGSVQSGTQVEIGQYYICGADAGNGDRAANLDSGRVNLRDTSSDAAIDVTDTLVNWAIQETVTVSGGAAPASSVATVIDDLPWTWAYVSEDDGTDASGIFPGTSCNASRDWRAFAGGYDLPYVSGTYSCDGQTGSAASGDIGSDRVDEGVLMTSTTGGWETANADADADVAHFAKGADDDYWLRIIFEADRPNANAYPLWFGLADANNQLRVTLTTGGVINVLLGTDAGDLTFGTTALIGVTPVEASLLDIFIDDASDNGLGKITVCFNGTCESQSDTEEFGAFGCKTATDCGTTNPARLDASLVSAHNQSGTYDDGNISFIGAIVGEGAWRLWDYETIHGTHATALGH